MNSHKKEKRKSGSGMQPQNSLGSKKLKMESPSLRRSMKLVVGSDKNLLLAPERKKKQKRSTYTLTQPLKNESNIRSKFPHCSYQDKVPIYKLMEDLETDINQNLLSDTEMNDLKIRTDRSLALEEFDSQTDPNVYDSVRFNPTKVILGDGERTLHDTIDNKSIRFVFSTSFTTMELYYNGQMIFGIDPSDLIDLVLFSDTKVMLIFNQGLTFEDQDLKSKSLLIYTGQQFTKAFENIWRELRSIRRLDIETEKLTTMEFHRKLRHYNYLNLLKALGGDTTELRSKSLGSKTFNSLNKGKKSKLPISRLGSTISTPKSNPKSSASAQSPASAKQFYSPLTTRSLATARLTRSTAKTDNHSSSPEPTRIEDSILVDDQGSRSRRSGRGLREVFKPSLVYSFRDKSYYKIKNMDFQCLYKSQWINDTLIDFFIKYFAEGAIDANKIKSDELHVFTTFFFTKLRSSENHYNNVKRWVSKIDFTSKKYIIVPINESLHWYCSIIVNFDKVLQKHDKTSVCKIYVFDSLKQDHKNILKSFQNFLVNYALDRFDIVVDPDRIELKNSPVPKQPNFNDCGVHVIYNVTIFLEDPDRCLKFWDKPFSKTNELTQFFKKKDREDMRDRLRKLLKHLQSEQAPRDDDSENDEPEEVHDDEDDDIVYIDADEFNDVKNKIESNEATEDTNDNNSSSETDSKNDDVLNKEYHFEDDDDDVKRSPKDSKSVHNDEKDRDPQDKNDQINGVSSSSSSTGELGSAIGDNTNGPREESVETDNQHQITQEDYNMGIDADISRLPQEKDKERFFSSEDEGENPKASKKSSNSPVKETLERLEEIPNGPNGFEDGEDGNSRKAKELNVDLEYDQDLENIDTQEDAQRQENHDDTPIKKNTSESLDSDSLALGVNSAPIPESQNNTGSSPVQISQELIDESEYSTAVNERKNNENQKGDTQGGSTQMKDIAVNDQFKDVTKVDEDDQELEKEENKEENNSKDVEMIPDDRQDSLMEMNHNGETKKISKSIGHSSEKDSINVDELKTDIEEIENSSPASTPREENRPISREVSYVEDDGYSSALSDVAEIPAEEAKEEESASKRNTRRVLSKTRNLRTPNRTRRGNPEIEQEVVEVKEAFNRPANRKRNEKKNLNRGASRSDALEVEDKPEDSKPPKSKGLKRGRKPKSR